LHPYQTCHSIIDILITIHRQLRRLTDAIELSPTIEFQTLFKEITQTVGSLVKFKGKGGGDSEIRKAKEFAKRPFLMDSLEYLGKSPMFRKVWTANMFKTLADWDMTVSLTSLWMILL
jgi:hypothetical protein